MLAPTLPCAGGAIIIDRPQLDRSPATPVDRPQRLSIARNACRCSIVNRRQDYYGVSNWGPLVKVDVEQVLEGINQAQALAAIDLKLHRGLNTWAQITCG